MHNAHFTREKGQPPFTADMWMPGYEAPEFDWRKSKEDLLAMFGQTEKTREQVAADQTARADFSDRRSQAKAAQERGASAEEIRLIMES